MNTAAKRLSRFLGRWKGRGVNHTSQPFHGVAHLQEILGGSGAQLSFTATGDEGTSYHQEETIFIADPAEGRLGAWSFNTNSGLTVLHECDLDGPHGEGEGTLQFSTGNLDRPTQFRERVTLKFVDPNRWAYCFEWGLPGGDFASRSSVILLRSEA